MNFNSKKYKRLAFVGLIFLVAFILTGCGEPTATPQSVATTQAAIFTQAANPTGAARQVTIALTPPPAVKNTRPATTRASNTASPTTGRINATPTLATARPATAAVSGDPKLVEKQSERTVLRTFTDKQGRVARLVYGRGNGHSGDYGWAHIYGKHVLSIWYDGGTITTFPKALGTKTPDEVAELVGKSITQDSNPDEQGNDRRTYSYPVPGTNRDVFTVVGSDGTIITSYPVQHGSKNED